MPIIKKIQHEKVTIAIWQIQEPVYYFHNKIYQHLSPLEKGEYESFTNLNRKKEYLCSRYLLHILTNTVTRIPIKKENKKPSLENSDKHISISHSKDFVAVSISDYHHAIDIEDKKRITPSLIKVGAKKFYNRNFPISKYTHIELWLLGESLIKYGYNLKEITNDIGTFGLKFETIKITEDQHIGILKQKID